ncbi:MAG TPA: DEAD/DEAH box helicase [Thermodesulfobacteriota bacterium]|nr:DEAD/DEAH box helicase [Thermodesulfobacteriota bacterium]
MSFDSFNLHPQIVAGVQALGYSTPTPIQRRAIPPILQGRDVLGLAQTGTGKTAAFVLPILQRLVKTPRGCIQALVIAPTRELTDQINVAFQALGRRTHLRSIPIYGGVPIAPQVQKLRSRVEIVVACPGRLLDHIHQGTIRLSNVEVLVLDEADRMLDMGFLPDIREILKHVPTVRQRLMFAATMPDEIRRLTKEVLRTPVTAQVNSSAPAATVAQAVYPVASHLKTALLLQLLRHTETASVLIFTRTKHRAQRLGAQIKRAGYPATSLQGNLSQNQRQVAIRGFRDGSYRVLVATDIAARGIDVSRISHVINYDMPDTTDAYTHRIGRTGRAEKTGDAFSLVTHEDEAMVRSIENVLGTRLERRRLNGFDYQMFPNERNNDPERGQAGHGRPKREKTFVPSQLVRGRVRRRTPGGPYPANLWLQER